MKTSEFPVGTVIEVVTNETKYQKDVSGTWHAIDGHCVDCMASDFISEIHIDAAEVKIISVPFGVVWQMAILLGDEYGHTDSEGEPITYQGLIKGAIDIHNEVLEREAKKVGQ